jgi:Gram-negative bacterial tonB protein.
MNSQTFRPIFLFFALFSSTLPGNLQSALASAKPATKAYLLKALNKIGPHWYQGVVKYGQNLPIGTVHFGFRINPEGRIENLKVLSNTSNQLFADIGRHAIEATKLPPIPQKALAEQGHNWIEMDLPFSLFANPAPKTTQPGRVLIRVRKTPNRSISSSTISPVFSQPPVFSGPSSKIHPNPTVPLPITSPGKRSASREACTIILGNV